VVSRLKTKKFLLSALSSRCRILSVWSLLHYTSPSHTHSVSPQTLSSILYISIMANGRRFSELFFRGSNSSADSRSSRADKSDEAPQYSRMPQAPPMERSGGYPEQSPSDSEYTISTASPSDERQSSYTCATSPERPSDLPSSRLEEEQNTVNFHDPLYCESTLLRKSRLPIASDSVRSFRDVM